MAEVPPIPMVYQGEGVFRALPRFVGVCAEYFGQGEVVTFVAHEDRSLKSHRHYFAAVNEAWQNLPEHLGDRFPTADHLRKFALIRTGWRDERTIACRSKAEARRVAAFVKPMDGYALVVPDGVMVIVYTAKSQSMRHMGREAFQRSKDDVLGFLATQIGISPQALERAAAA